MGAARMATDIIDMVWYVPVAGHCWCDARPIIEGQERERPARVMVSEPGEWRRYTPLRDVPDLFRRFAALEFPDDVPACEENVRRFADQYGGLGVGFVVILPDNEGRSGTDLATWYWEWFLMNMVLKVWDTLEASDNETLARWFPSTTNTLYGVGMFTPDDLVPSIVNLEPSIHFTSDDAAPQFRHLAVAHGTDPTDHWRDYPSDPVHWATLHLRKWVNQQLEAHTSGRLQYEPFASDRRTLRTVLIPNNLIGGIWLQFALAIEGTLRLERCEECGQWFPVKPKGNRANTRFCKDYCRVKASRRRNEKRKATTR
jgi:hypothetical protein